MSEIVAVIDPFGKVEVEGYGDMTEDVARELARIRTDDLDNVALKCDARQRFLAREHGEANFFDGGALVGQVDEAVYQHYVDRYGPEFFSDKSNRHWFLKKYPECKVKSTAVSTTVRQGDQAYRISDRRSSAAALTPGAKLPCA